MNNIEKVIKERVKKNTFFKKSHKNWFFFFFFHHLSKFNIASMFQEIFEINLAGFDCCVLMMNEWMNGKIDVRGNFWMHSKIFLSHFIFRMILCVNLSGQTPVKFRHFFPLKYQYLKCFWNEDEGDVYRSESLIMFFMILLCKYLSSLIKYANICLDKNY